VSSKGLSRKQRLFWLEIFMGTPHPPGNSHEFQRKGLTEKALSKVLKIKGRFAMELHKDALGRGEGAIRARVGQDKHETA
jgi:hypothetical protein